MRRAVVAALVVAGVLAVVHQPPPAWLGGSPDAGAGGAGYPADAQARFVGGCEDHGGSPALCGCLFTEMRRRYDYAEFQVLARAPGTPAELREVAAACAGR